PGRQCSAAGRHSPRAAWPGRGTAPRATFPPARPRERPRAVAARSAGWPALPWRDRGRPSWSKGHRGFRGGRARGRRGSGVWNRAKRLAFMVRIGNGVLRKSGAESRLVPSELRWPARKERGHALGMIVALGIGKVLVQLGVRQGLRLQRQAPDGGLIDAC